MISKLGMRDPAVTRETCQTLLHGYIMWLTLCNLSLCPVAQGPQWWSSVDGQLRDALTREHEARSRKGQ